MGVTKSTSSIGESSGPGKNSGVKGEWHKVNNSIDTRLGPTLPRKRKHLSWADGGGSKRHGYQVHSTVLHINLLGRGGKKESVHRKIGQKVHAARRRAGRRE